jgi:hypothetical protein
VKVSQALAIRACSFLTNPCLHAQTKKLTTAESEDLIGDRATVCGKVLSTHYAKSSKDEATFLNLDEPYPKEVFAILTWGSGREKFGPRRRIQRIAGVHHGKDNELSGPAGDRRYGARTD